MLSAYSVLLFPSATSALCTFQKFGFDSLDIFVSTDCFFVTKLMIYTCPEIHSDRADLDFGAHWKFSLCKENRNLNDIEAIEAELLKCAQTVSETDCHMEEIKDMIGDFEKI